MIDKIKDAKTYEELQEVVASIYAEVDKGIKDARERIIDLGKVIKERGTNSLEAVQENTKDKLELDQVTEFYNNQVAKREKLVNEYSRAIYSKASSFKSKKQNEFDNVELTKAKKEALEHWKAILNLENNLNERRIENNNQAKELITAFETYYTDDQKNSAYYFSGTYSNISLSEMIKDNRLKLSDLEELNKTDEEKRQEELERQKEEQAKQKRLEEFKEKNLTKPYL